MQLIISQGNVWNTVTTHADLFADQKVMQVNEPGTVISASVVPHLSSSVITVWETQAYMSRLPPVLFGGHTMKDTFLRELFDDWKENTVVRDRNFTNKKLCSLNFLKDESGFPDQATTLPSLLMIIHKTCNTRLWTRNHKMYFKTLLLRTYVNVEQSEWVWLSNNGDNTNTNNIFSKSALVAVCSAAKQHIRLALMVHLF